MRCSPFFSAVFFVSVAAGSIAPAHADVFTDGFEGATLDPFWSTREDSGSITLSSAGEVHGGSQAVQFTSTANTGEKNIWLIHDYGEPMHGRVSVWLYDTGADVSSSNYLKFYLLNPDAPGAALGTADYDLGPGNGGEYGFSLGASSSGNTAIDRTQDWHLFEIEMLPDSATMWVDGTQVATQSTGLFFQEVALAMRGPTWRPAWVSYWDDFEADVIPVPPVPTLSEWGLVAMTLVLLTAGTLVLARHRVSRVAA